jgi:hypothetical protein
MAVDFAIICSLVRPGRPRYPVLVHRAATLLHASSGRRLAMTPLRFANPSPPSGWIEDFHLQAVDHARHTKKAPRCGAKVLPTGPEGQSTQNIQTVRAIRPNSTALCRSHARRRPKELTTGEPIVRSRPAARVAWCRPFRLRLMGALGPGSPDHSTGAFRFRRRPRDGRQKRTGDDEDAPRRAI